MNPGQVSQPSSFVVDPQRDGVANALWKALTGAPSVAGGKFRFNTADGLVRADLRYAIVDFSINLPLTGVQTPANLVDDLAFGLKGAALGDLGRIEVLFDKSEDNAALNTYDEFGTVTQTVLTLDAGWNAARTLFRVEWAPNHVTLKALKASATAWVTLASHKDSDTTPAGIPNRPLSPHVKSVGAQNFDVDFIAVTRAQGSSIMLI